jgi:hypothetical protein
MTDYKATPKQWTQTEQWAAMGGGQEACILELRARVEALEANSKPTPNDRQIRSSLVGRVSAAIVRVDEGHDWTHAETIATDEARAAIREVAGWMNENQSPVTAQWLEEEAER